MLMRDKIAGVLVAVGVIGLALAPLKSTQVASAANLTKSGDVTIAIASGSQLHLFQEGGFQPKNQQRAKTEQKMLCSNVFRLTIADVGLHCRNLPAVLASMRQ